MISFNGDRFNPHGIPFPALPQSELDWRTHSLQREASLGHERLGSGNSAQRTIGREKERSLPLFLHPRVPSELIIIIILFLVFILFWSTRNLCGGENNQVLNIACGKFSIMRCHLGNRITL